MSQKSSVCLCVRGSMLISFHMSLYKIHLSLKQLGHLNKPLDVVT